MCETPASPTAGAPGGAAEEDPLAPDEEDDDSSDDGSPRRWTSSSKGGRKGKAGASETAGATTSSTETAEKEREKLKQEALNSNADMVIISAKGKFTQASRFETRMEASMLMQNMGGTTPAKVQEEMDDWDDEDDRALLTYINEVQSRNGSINIFASPFCFALKKNFLTYRAVHLGRKTILDVQNRALFLQQLNKTLEELLPLFNIRSSDPLSMGAVIRQHNRYIFMSQKLPMLEKAITASAFSGSQVALSLDNAKAFASRDLKELDPTNSQNIFVQAYRQLSTKDASAFRYAHSDGRIFQITFVNEQGIDAGGVFREGMTRIIEDLFSEHFNLLVLCPNGQHTVHVNMEKYVPNPTQTGTLALKMFEFIGQLMGASLRCKMCLPFEFPSIIWKKLSGEPVSGEDLLQFDFYTHKLLDAVRHCEREGITDQPSFAAKFNDKEQINFVYTGSDGVERPLPGQRSRPVTFQTRHEYCDAVTAARLSEFDRQIAAMERGLNEVVPCRALRLFSGEQLEVLVAGDPNFDIPLWKSKTNASDLSPKTVELFWQVMESLTRKEQSGFVRFAWGRSRLPAAKDFTTQMRLTRTTTSKLPISHTCFFSVEMPEYKTLEEMRHGLLTVINFGVGGILMS